MGVVFTGLWSKKLNWTTVIIVWSSYYHNKIKYCRLNKKGSQRDFTMCFLGHQFGLLRNVLFSFPSFFLLSRNECTHIVCLAIIFRWVWNTDKDVNHITLLPNSTFVNILKQRWECGKTPQTCRQIKKMKQTT